MKFLLFALLISTQVFADRKPNATVPNETVLRLKQLYPEQSDAFIYERIYNAKTTFEKWRAFPPYFYNLVSRSEAILGKKFNERKGLCAGDAHFENFGFMYMGRAFFSLNDLDDASACALNADALRLFVGHRLLFPVKASEWVSEYKAGLSGLNTPAPVYLEKLEKESNKKKTEISKKYKKLLESKTCSDDFLPASAEETKLITEYLASEGKKLALVCTRTKNTGGSAGSRRYVVFYPISSGHDVFELKPLNSPAPFAPLVLPVKERALMYEQAVAVFLGANFRAAYYPVILGRKIYQRRPIWGGNVEVTEGTLTSNDLTEVALYQARILGRYHRITNTAQFSYSAEEWDKMAQDLENKWRKEFAE